MNHPSHYFGICRICGEGALGAWICGACNSAVVMCDECDATWATPDSAAEPSYSELLQMPCSDCGAPILLPPSHWADRARITELGWSHLLAENGAEQKNDDLDLPDDQPGNN